MFKIYNKPNNGYRIFPKIIMHLDTYLQLGIHNILTVIWYRLRLKLKLHRVQYIRAVEAQGLFFRDNINIVKTFNSKITYINDIYLFGWYKYPLSSKVPSWFENPLDPIQKLPSTLPWWEIKDFGKFDIKTIWELSRFDWVTIFGLNYIAGDREAIKYLNKWLNDWNISNQPYLGPNWKCGQEASIRVIHLVFTSWILEQEQNPEPALILLLQNNLKRIQETISYANAQNNNHSTSEAAALYVGGAFLEGFDLRSQSWMQMGKRLLEKCADSLIFDDGSFSQYSTNYHRLMLDVYSFSEAWRRHKNLHNFSKRTYKKLASATIFLMSLTDDNTGDVPNLGANDGANLISMATADYRDFRPSVQLASALFLGKNAFKPGMWDLYKELMNIEVKKNGSKLQSRSFTNGGYHFLKSNRCKVLFRYPIFKFRPSQADMLHVDFWCDGLNIFRDSGTFSYNSENMEWFASIAAHNSIQFDNRDVMPRLGRFLFGKWVKAHNIRLVNNNKGYITASAAYIDFWGAEHTRKVKLGKSEFICEDVLAGSFMTGILRWRLAPLNWDLKEGSVFAEDYEISILKDGKKICPKLETTLESKYYLNKKRIPELSIKIYEPSTIITKINF